VPTAAADYFKFLPIRVWNSNDRSRRQARSPGRCHAWIAIAAQSADHLARDIDALATEVQALQLDLTGKARANLELRRLLDSGPRDAD
jgi:hypothetical protein